jgi:osmotically-inducible protein OsmY
MKKLIILLIMTIPLLGCVAAVPVAIVAGATAGGAVIYDKRSFKTMSKDQNARNYAQSWLDSDPLLKGHSHISISVFNHIALLVGQAQTPEIRDRAYQIVSRVKNIKRIYNEITITQPISALQRTNDTWITTKVKTAMLAKSGLHSTNLKVVTEDKVVYLMGFVSRKQAALASDTARRISGVTKVVKVFEYEQ